MTDGSPRFVACAPGRLDVMGGLAEYTGSLVVNTPIGGHVCVGVQRRSDGKLSILFPPLTGSDSPSPTVISASQLRGADGTIIDARQGRRLLNGTEGDGARCVLGSLVEMLRDGLLSAIEGGLSIVVGTTLEGLVDVGQDAALAAATLVSIAAAYQVSLEGLEVAAVCQRVENDWLDAPIGVGDAVCGLWGQPHALMQVRCEPCTPAGSIRLPDDLALVGIDCQAIHPEAKLKYQRVRTATFMGRAVIDRIIQHEGVNHKPLWEGYLSRISIEDYVERFRDRLTTKLKGGEYLERFGETGDPLTRVDPSFVYKIRSRTEHHIYEHARACQFTQHLSKAIQHSDKRALLEAGELMYASHWSYGQRCGLGSIETDLLVNLIRQHGVECDIFGARITGRGCGGGVVLLMRPSERAHKSVESVMEAYKTRTGKTATLMQSSSPGALVGGARQV